MNPIGSKYQPPHMRINFPIKTEPCFPVKNPSEKLCLNHPFVSRHPPTKTSTAANWMMSRPSITRNWIVWRTSWSTFDSNVETLTFRSPNQVKSHRWAKSISTTRPEWQRKRTIVHWRDSRWNRGCFQWRPFIKLSRTSSSGRRSFLPCWSPVPKTSSCCKWRRITGNWHKLFDSFTSLIISDD